jgi:hypothetical protein
LKKRSKKLLHLGIVRPAKHAAATATPTVKSFLLLFFKKEDFFLAYSSVIIPH